MTDEELTERVMCALHDVLDPETGINIVDLGLVYGVKADASTGAVDLTITFTSPACPAGETIMAGIERRLSLENAVSSTELCLSFEPRWTPERITREGRRDLGMDD